MTTHENELAVSVASATPTTLRWNTMTVTMLTVTLIRPATQRMYSGVRVSPLLRRMAAPKL